MTTIEKKNRTCSILCTAITSLVPIIIFVTTLGAVPQPVLTIAPTGTNQFLITITNGVSSVNYEIYRTPVLGDDFNFPFTLHIIGEIGQTNFTIETGNETSGFVLAAVGSDWDGDGVDNYWDANPNDPSIGALTVTIDSPSSGQLFQ